MNSARKERIITFRNFDNLIQANLAKTKLDAYGIPCFLVNENFNNLYPIHNTRFSGVRLNIFETDWIRANELVPEDQTQSQISCPHCQSNDVQELPNASNEANPFMESLREFLFLKTPRPTFRCRNCNHEFSSQ